MYEATFARLSSDIEVCRLAHAGPLPAPWVAPGFVANLVLEGAASLRVRGRDHLTVPGDVVLVEPDDVRFLTRRYRDLAVTRSLVVAPERFRAGMDERGRRRGGFAANVVKRAPLARSIVQLYRAIDARAARLVIDVRLEAVLDGLADEWCVTARGPRADDRPVAAARDRICADFAEDLSLDELARDAGLSRPQFLRRFRSVVGMPPHRFLIHVRIARARTLLREGVDVAAVSAAVGFFDQSHLHRHFVRLVGVSPGVYQRAGR